MKKKKVFIIIILTIIVSIMFMNTSNAALQSNNGTKKAYNISDWLKNIRNMEASGGTFGLNAEIDENSLLDKGESNGLDVHMEKNTEYGALAILSASSYGNPENVSGKGATTTGNCTGVVMDYIEIVSAISSEKEYSNKIITNSDNRYKNVYTKDSAGKYEYFKGDATKETQGWQNSLFQDIKLLITRGGRDFTGDSSFSNIFSSCTEYVWIGSEPYKENHAYTSRAVVVIGDGI